VSGRIGREEKAVARKRSRRKKLMDGMGVSSIRLMASGPVRGYFSRVFPIYSLDWVTLCEFIVSVSLSLSGGRGVAGPATFASLVS
jgi:plastocyanin domain-containing protein